MIGRWGNGWFEGKENADWIGLKYNALDKLHWLNYADVQLFCKIQSCDGVKAKAEAPSEITQCIFFDRHL